MGMLVLSSCAKKENPEATPAERGSAKAAAPEAGAARYWAACVRPSEKWKRFAGAIVASSQTDMVVSGDDGIEHKIPLSQIKSVEYGVSATKQAPAAIASKKIPSENNPRPLRVRRRKSRLRRSQNPPRLLRPLPLLDR